MRYSTRFLTLLIVLLAACSGEATAPMPSSVPSTPVADLPISQSLAERDRFIPTQIAESVIAEADAEYLLLTNLYERTAPAVVNVEVTADEGGYSVYDLSRGSGFVFDRNGHIVTNAHVIADATDVVVTFDDGLVASAQIIGVDVYSDIAVLRVDVSPNRLVPLEMADSDTVRVGERAIAIGNPFGLSSSMTVGIVSAIGRQLRSADLIGEDVLPGFQNPRIIQVDTTINPGNSGGPLLNSHGRVMGVNTAIRTDSGRFQGVGFAVPANTVTRVVPELISKGRVDYSWVGISTFSTDEGLSLAALADEVDLPVSEGVLVTHVWTNSPAAEADLRGGTETVRVRDGSDVCVGGDMIIAVNGEFVEDMDELLAYMVMQTVPGDTVNLMVVRGVETFEVPLTLSARPDSGSEQIQCR
jgi:S1-C subfamily serine protease